MKLLIIFLLITIGLAKTPITFIQGKCLSDRFFLPCGVYSDDRIYINGKYHTDYIISDVILFKGIVHFMMDTKSGNKLGLIKEKK